MTEPVYRLFMDMMFWWILLGIGGGMTYGRWRAERIRAHRDMKNVWTGRKSYRNYRQWKIRR